MRVALGCCTFQTQHFSIGGGRTHFSWESNCFQWQTILQCPLKIYQTNLSLAYVDRYQLENTFIVLLYWQTFLAFWVVNTESVKLC